MIDLDRVRRNVGRMIDQDAPDAEIEAYLADEGVPADTLRAGPAKAAAAPAAPPAVTSLDALGSTTGFEVPGTEPTGTAVPFSDMVRGMGRQADDAVRAVADGATFGLADRAAAGMRSLTEGGSYGDKLAEERKRTAELPTALKVGGAVVGGVGTGVGLAKAGVTLAPHMSKVLETGEKVRRGLAARMGLMGAEGAAYGVADKVGHTDELAKVPAAIGQGALEGGALGAALPLGGRVAELGYRAGAAALSPAIGGLSGKTSRLVTGALDASGDDALRASSHEAEMLVDRSKALRGLGEGVVANPTSAGARTMETNLDARAQATPARLAGDVEQNLGPRPLSPAAAKAEIDEFGKATRAPLNAAADAAPAPTGQRFDELAQRPDVMRGINQGARNAANEGNPLPTITRDAATGQVVPDSVAQNFTLTSRGRIDQAVGDLLGHGKYLGTEERLLLDRREAAGEPYRTAYQAAIDYTADAGQKLTALLDRIPAEAKKFANRLLAIDGKLPKAPTGALTEVSFEAPRTGRPQSLNTFIRNQGGIRPGPEGMAGAAELKQAGAGRLVNGKGVDIDRMREAAAEAGYLPPESTVADFLDLIEKGANGRPVYRMGEVGPRRAIDPGREAADMAVHEEALSEIVLAQMRAGKPQSAIDRKVAEDAAFRMAFEGVSNPIAAYERAAADAAIGRSVGGKAAGPATPELTVEHWDYLKRGLDDAIEDAGPRTQVGSKLVALKRELLGELDRAAPDLAVARDIFAGEKALEKALQNGRAMAADNVTREELAIAFRDLTSDSERELFRLGLGSAMRDKLAKVSDKSGDLPHAVVGNQVIREKLATVAPSEEALQRFYRRLEGERRSFEEAQRPTSRAWRDAHEDLSASARKAADDPEREGVARGLRTASDDLEAALSEANPAFKAALERRREYERLGSAIDRGGEVLTGGSKNAIRPDDLRRELAGMSPAEREALKLGVRGDIDDSVGTASNDLLALRRKLGGEADYNREKMADVFGQDARDNLVGAVNRETGFAATRNTLVGGSRTTPRATAAAQIDGTTFNPPADATLTGLGLRAGRKAAGMLVGAVGGRNSERVRSELGDLLTKTGKDRDEVLEKLLEAVRSRRATGQGIEELSRGPSALQGLLGATGERDRREPRGIASRGSKPPQTGRR